MASIWSRLKQGLARTRAQLTDRLQALLSGQAITRDVLEELEEILIGADIGVDATSDILEALESGEGRASGPSWAVNTVRAYMNDILTRKPAALASAEEPPTVIVVVGVNGVGKTTTIGKLAGRYAAEGKRVLIGAADTFRAAADEQLDIWARRAGAEIVRQQHGADAASVAFDAANAARSRQSDVVIIDTAGRLHTKSNLMAELQKIVRVLQKIDPAYPHEVLLVLDATTGQNALTQAQQFSSAVGVTGIALTKLDSSAKGGMIIAIAKELGIPVKLVGVGEQIADLQDFRAEAFVEALFSGDARQS